MGNHAARLQHPRVARAQLAEGMTDFEIERAVRIERERIVDDLQYGDLYTREEAEKAFEQLCQDGKYVEQADGSLVQPYDPSEFYYDGDWY